MGTFSRMTSRASKRARKGQLSASEQAARTWKYVAGGLFTALLGLALALIPLLRELAEKKQVEGDLKDCGETLEAAKNDLESLRATSQLLNLVDSSFWAFASFGLKSVGQSVAVGECARGPCYRVTLVGTRLETDPPAVYLRVEGEGFAVVPKEQAHREPGMVLDMTHSFNLEKGVLIDPGTGDVRIELPLVAGGKRLVTTEVHDFQFVILDDTVQAMELGLAIREGTEHGQTVFHTATWPGRHF